MTNLNYLWVVLFLVLPHFLFGQNIRKIERQVLYSIEKSTDDYLVKARITDKALPEWRIKDALYYAYYYNNRIFENQGGYFGQLLDGQYYKFNKSNLLIERGRFKYGLRKGLWKYWDDSGKLLRQIKWKKGKEHNVIEGPDMEKKPKSKKDSDKAVKKKKEKKPKQKDKEKGVKEKKEEVPGGR